MIATYIWLMMAFGFSFVITVLILPSLIRKMHAGGMTGVDINKHQKPRVAELGGISALFGFSIGLSLVVGMEKLVIPRSGHDLPVLAAIGVFFIAGTFGLIDDISRLSQRLKAIALVFAALPLVLWHGQNFPSVLEIQLPGGGTFSFENYYYIFWLLGVPLGITSAANALNMSAGYNGLESGQIMIISFFLLLIALIKGSPEPAVLIFAGLIGCASGLFIFNRYPASVFVGDIGTLGLGAAVATGTIIGSIELFGIICIIPSFYEAGATLYYNIRGIPRRHICRRPIILSDGRLKPPPGAERFTLAFLLLTRRPMKEQALVHSLLLLYTLFGLIALVLAII